MRVIFAYPRPCVLSHFFSRTYSGYIVRLRGYFGMSKFSTYYSWLDRKYFMHKWMNSWEASLFSREVSSFLHRYCMNHTPFGSDD